jgi:hypothetical protein
VAPDGPDFFGGALRFVGDVLNALFNMETRNRGLTIWTSNDVSMTDFSTATALEPAAMAAASAPISIQQRVHDEIAALQQADPDFSDLQFLGQATTQYQGYLTADGAMTADALSSVGTPDFIDWFGKRVASLDGSGLRRVVSDVKMLGAAVIRVSIDGTAQSIVVRFSGSGVRYTQDVDTGTATEGSAQPGSFTEFGTFVRPAGATTPKSAGAGAATHCPSCGAPTSSGAATCPFCGTQLTGTGSTWLLDKISASAYT